MSSSTVNNDNGSANVDENTSNPAVNANDETLGAVRNTNGGYLGEQQDMIIERPQLDLTGGLTREELLPIEAKCKQQQADNKAEAYVTIG